MGNREGRRITRKTKIEGAGFPLSEAGPVFTRPGVPDNGDNPILTSSFYPCPMRQQQVSVDVCIVRQHRFPGDCKRSQCSHYKVPA